MRTIGNGTDTLPITLKKKIEKAQLTWNRLDMNQLLLDDSSDW